MTFTLNSPASAVTTQKSSILATASSKPEGTKLDKTESKRLDDASRQFEAVFLRQMLSCLEKTTSTLGGKDAGSNIYGSMMVDAVADAVSQAGGIGLGAMLKRTLEPQIARQTAVTSDVGMSQSHYEPGSSDATGLERGDPL
jgi:Rod binding domain-containing protein